MFKKIAAAILVGLALASIDVAARDSIWVEVPYTPGGSADQSARLVTHRLSSVSNKNFVIEYKPGAGGVTAAMSVIQSEPKGSKLLLASISTLALNKALFKSLPYDPSRDFVPVVGLTQSPMVLVARPSIPASNLKELVAYAKTKKDGLVLGSPGIGSIPHLAGMYCFRKLGVDVLHVPFKGIAPAIVALLSNNVDVVFDTLSTAEANIKAGKVKALAIASDHRFSDLPQLPTFKEQGMDLEVSSWFGLAAPVGTPKAQIDELNKQVNVVLSDAEFRKQLSKLGLEPILGSAKDFEAYVRARSDQWLPELTRLNLKPY